MGSCENLSPVSEAALDGVSVEIDRRLETADRPITEPLVWAEKSQGITDFGINGIGEPSGCLVFSRESNAGCVSLADAIEAIVDVRDGMKDECEIGLCLSSEMLPENECAAYSNGSLCEIDDVYQVKTNGLNLRKEECVGANRLEKLSEGSKSSFEVIPAMEISYICLEDRIDDKNISCVSDAENPLESMPGVALRIDCAQKDEPKNDKNFLSSSVQGFTEDIIVEKADNLTGLHKDTCGKLFPTQGYESSSELISMISSPKLCIKADELHGDVSVCASSLHGALEGIEDELYISPEMVADDLPQTLLTQKSGEREDDKAINSCYSESENDVPGVHTDPSNQFLSAQGSDKHDEQALIGKDAADFFSCTGTINRLRPTDNGDQHRVRVDHISEIKFPDTVLSYSRRSNRKSKSSQNNGSKRSVENSKKASRRKQSKEGMESIFKSTRRKRSCASKPARDSMWGLSGNITHFFLQRNAPAFNQLQNQGSQKSKDKRGSVNRNKDLAGGSSQGSIRKNLSSESCLRFKVKVGKANVQSTLNSSAPAVVDDLLSVDDTVSGYGTELRQGTTSEIPKLANGVEENYGQEGAEGHYICSKNPDKELEYGDPIDFVNGLKREEKYINCVFSGKSVGDDDLELVSNLVSEEPQVLTANIYMDPGTSPDSEVINSVPDAQAGAKHQEDMHNAVLGTSKTDDVRTDVISRKKEKKKGKKKDCLPDSLKKRKSSKKQRDTQVMANGAYITHVRSSSSSNKSSSKGVSIEPSDLLGETDLGVTDEGLIVGSCVKSNASLKPDVNIRLTESESSKDFHPPTESEGLPSNKVKIHGLSKSSKSCGAGNGKTEFSGSAKSKRGNAFRDKDSQRKSVTESKIRENDACDLVNDKAECQQATGVANLEAVVGGAVEQSVSPDSAWVLCDDCRQWRRIDVSLANSIGDSPWTCNENLDKAFANCSIPQEKSDEDINAELNISDEDACDGHLNYKEEDKGLECKSLPVLQDSRFKGIKSNEFLHRGRKNQIIDEIMVCHCKPPTDGRLGCGDECLNRMLNIECVQGTCPCGDLCSNQQFQRRKYTKLEWFRSGKKGFGLRVLDDIPKGQFLIEYVGEVLDMQAYEARQKDYAAKGQKHFYFMTLNGSEVIDAGNKGNLGRFINHSCEPNCRTEKWMVNGEICIGIFAMKDIKKLQEVTFDYNYVRVFGAAAKKCYCDSPQCRGYIGGDPLNTEFIVQGDSDEEYPEPVMLRNDKRGHGNKKITSKTISNNDEKVQREVKMKKSGEKLNNSEVAVQQADTTKIDDFIGQSASADSSVLSSVEMGDLEGKSSSLQHVEVPLQTEDATSESVAVVQQDVSMEEETMNTSSPSTPILDTTSRPILDTTSPPILDTTSPPILDTTSPPILDTTSPPMMPVRLDSVDDNKPGKSVLPKSLHRVKSSRSSGSFKKGKGTCNIAERSKPQITTPHQSQVLPIKPKKISEGSSGSRIETVEDKLNELLDDDGGVSRRKDAPKGYLKLLLLTAASGDSASSEAIQSNRDLSMIIDALLKTKSRAVLLDIINKNGLRMLHNILKKYRRDFKKIPILRKLLKVIEYLAAREILTLDHITGGPPCPGMESFKDSMLSLTEHDDKQVHQIARNFRDRWIPRHYRKISFMDRDDHRIASYRGSNFSRFSASHSHRYDPGVKPTESVDDVMRSKVIPTAVNSAVNEGCSEPSTSTCQTTGTRIRKRKSRWDQPAEPNTFSCSSQNKEQKTESMVAHKQFEPSVLSKTSKEDPRHNIRHEEAVSGDTIGQSSLDDVPPGFSSPLNPPNCFTQNFPSDVVVAHPAEKFLSRLPVSYGIPLAIAHQFGSPHSEISESWAIAPGMPFHPFPPLPPFPREKKETSTSSAVNSVAINEHKEDTQQQHSHTSSCQVDNRQSRIVGNQLDTNTTPGPNNGQVFKRPREPTNDLGGSYSRPQKWNTPPWVRNGWRNTGDNLKGGPDNLNVENIRNELGNPFCSQDVSSRVDKSGYNLDQHQKQ